MCGKIPTHGSIGSCGEMHRSAEVLYLRYSKNSTHNTLYERPVEQQGPMPSASKWPHNSLIRQFQIIPYNYVSSGCSVNN